MDQGEHSDVIVVLGASLSRDGTPNPALSRRSEHAAGLWKAGIGRMGFDVALSPVAVSKIGPAFYVLSVVREVAALHRQVLR